jgi:SulP family sulfate permease
MNGIAKLNLRNIRGDIYGGLTAAVVALPLALAFGVASGAGPVAGLYGAVFTGFFAALFGGTPAQVSGPTGPMTVIMASIITQFAHNPALAFTVVMMGGVLQMIFGIVKIGRYINLVPFSVVSGFMSGIGCIIVILELGPLLGHANPAGGTLTVLAALPSIISNPVPHALLLGLVTLIIMFFTPAAVNRLLPAPLIALGVGTLLSLTVLSGVPIIGYIPDGLPNPHLPAFELKFLPTMIKSALVLALLGSIDSLLTSLVADNITRSRHDSDQELVGQGLGNLIAGCLGGIPGAGATMRTVINVRAGGRTPVSGIIHALVLLVIVLGFGGAAAYIPHAVLAGILLKVGYDIVDWDFLRRIPHAPRTSVTLVLTVLFLTVLADLMTAVGVGMVIASLLFVQRMSELQKEGVRVRSDEDEAITPEERVILRRHAGHIALCELSGPLSFGAAKHMANSLGTFDYCEVIVLDLSHTTMLDDSAAMAIEDMIEQAQAQGKHVLLAGMPLQIARVLNRMGVLQRLEKDGRFRYRHSALLRADRLLQDKA